MSPLKEIISELRFMEKVDNFNGASGYLDDLEERAKIYDLMVLALRLARVRASLSPVDPQIVDVLDQVIGMAE